MDEDIAAFSLKQAQKYGASYAEARLEKTKASSLVMKNGMIEASSYDSFQGIGIRFIINKKLGFVSTNELTKKRIRASRGMMELVKAVEYAKLLYNILNEPNLRRLFCFLLSYLLHFQHRHIPKLYFLDNIQY